MPHEPKGRKTNIDVKVATTRPTFTNDSGSDATIFLQTIEQQTAIARPPAMYGARYGAFSSEPISYEGKDPKRYERARTER
jgi:hypothetical protein